MKNALVPGLGGPMGRHASRRGIWFNPLPWAALVATLSFVVLFLRHTPCVQTAAADEIDAYARLCYSDIQGMFRAQGLALGGSPFSGDTLGVAPLVGVLLLAAALVASLIGVPVGPFSSAQDQVDASVVAFGVVTVVLFVCLLVWIVAAAKWGRGGRVGSSWDAMLVASSLIVAASGLVSWDLLPLSLTAVALALFARRRTVEAGVVLGIAASAGTMPMVVALAVVVVASLRGGWRVSLGVAVPATLSWVLVHVPLLLANPGAMFRYYLGQVQAERGYGSFWYLLELWGVPVRSAGSLAFVFMILALGCLTAYLYVARRRPRVGSMIAVAILTVTVLGASFPPQASLWVLLAVVVSRPLRPELVAATVVHVGYYLAIWGWLAGALTTAQFGPYGIYWGAIIARVAVDTWILVISVADMVHPGSDPLRGPDDPDPLGGILNDGELAPAPIPTGM